MPLSLRGHGGPPLPVGVESESLTRAHGGAQRLVCCQPNVIVAARDVVTTCHGAFVSGAALRPTSVLDGFFSDDVDAVAAAARALRSDQALLEPADRSWGRIDEPAALLAGGKRTDPKGVYSEAIFGPRRVLKCACGATKGDAHRDQVCPKCGVLCGDPSLRDWRFAHVDVPVAIHPSMIGEVAKALAMSVDGVHAVLESDGNPTISGPHALATLLNESAAPQALKDAAIVRRVPVPPPGDRRLVLHLTAAQTTPWIGPVNEAWISLVEASNALRGIEAGTLALDAPDLALADAARRVQRTLARVVELTRKPPHAHEHTRWIPAPPFEGVEAPQPMTDVGDVPPRIDLMPATANARAVFVDDFTFLVQRNNEVLHFDIDGKRKHRFRSPGRALRSVHVDTSSGAGASTTRVVFDGWLVNPWLWHIAYPDVDDEDPASVAAAAMLHEQHVHAAAGNMAPLAVFDLRTKKWLSSWPDELACIAAHRADNGDIGFVDRKTFAYLRTPFVRPSTPTPTALLAWSRDARYAWIGNDSSGGVIDVESGIPQIEPHVDEGREAGVVESPGEAACAIGLTEELAWRFVHFDGALTDGKRVLANLGVFETVAFSPTCKWVVTVRAHDVEVFDASGHLSRKFRLP